MSDLLNKASLVVIPSGYKEDTVYSVVPSDGSGDLSFTRASNGTRVNSAGLVEVCPWNLLQYSNTFSNGVWVTGGYGNLPTLTANSIANPVNGLTDAWTASFAAAGTQGRLLQLFTGLSNGVPYTYSMYIKAGTKTSVAIYSDTATVGLNAIFNLSNGTISSTSGTTATITAMTNGWYYVTITNNILSSGNGQYGIVTNTGEDGTLYIYGAQLNIGATAKPYFPTTDRLNVPRLTYQNGGGGCPSLLLEKQSTNIALYSEDFTNAAWAKTNITITTNDATSPDGTQNADKIVITGGANSINQGTAQITNNTITFSVYAKKGTANIFRIRESFYFGTTVTFDLSNGTITSGTGTITDVGNGWYRCTMTQAYGSGQLNVNWIFDSTSSSGNFYLWGAQIEASSYPTSYIPTTSASATRVADACFKTGISSLIGQTEGTIFADFYWNGNAVENWLGSVQTSTTNFVAIFLLEDGRPYYYILNSGSAQMAYIGTALSIGRHKMAIGYKQNDSVAYMDGNLLNTDTSCTIPATSEFRIGSISSSSGQEARINQSVLFKTRLTNAELASLTTL